MVKLTTVWSVFELVVSVVFGVVVAGISVWALVEAVTFGRRRYQYRSLNDDSAMTQAAASVVEARSRLAAVVDAEQRTASIGSGGNRPRTTEVFDDERGVAREALLDAQRLWEAVRPRRDTAARVGLWSGRGSIRAWHLGLIGFERAIIRCDHVVDPSCWVLREYRRVRIGFGFGVESRSLALFAAGLPSRRIDELMRHLISGPEFALRPGRSPVAVGGSASAIALLRTQPGRCSSTRISPVLPRRRAPKQYGQPFAPTSATMSGRGRCRALMRRSGWSTPQDPPSSSGHGWGRRPRSRLLAASQHTVWRESL